MIDVLYYGLMFFVVLASAFLTTLVYFALRYAWKRGWVRKGASALKRFAVWLKSRRKRKKRAVKKTSLVGKILAAFLLPPMLGLTFTSFGGGVATLTLLNGAGIFGTFLTATAFVLAAVFAITTAVLVIMVVR